jgi:hypothetical protein
VKDDDHPPAPAYEHVPPPPVFLVGRVVPWVLDGEACHAVVLGITGEEARICVYGPGEYGHVSARTVPISSIDTKEPL